MDEVDQLRQAVPTEHEIRNAALEEAAASCDRMAVHYDEYASKYDDEDGARAECQALTCRSRAEAIRNMKTK